LLLNGNITDIKALLISQYMCSNQDKSAEISFQKVKERFLGFGRQTNNFNVSLARAKKQDLICEQANEESKALYLTASGLKAVKDLIGDTLSNRTYIIQAGKVFSGKRLLQEIIQNEIGMNLKLCDPYIGSRTLDFINIDKKCAIRILTQTIENKTNFQRELADFRREYPAITVEVKIYSKNALHDRYMLSDTTVWSIGSSLKDLGNKDTIINQLGQEVFSALEQMFETRWQESTDFK
jgi:hypothetical protein